MNAGQIIVIGLSVALLLWFAGGIWYNRRLAWQIWRWLEPGLHLFGGQVSERWIGRSGAGLRVVIDNPDPPLHRLELVASLLSRDNAPLWLVERVQGKRDQLTFRAWLESPDRAEIEAVQVGGALYQTLHAQTDHPWRRAYESSHWAVYSRGSPKRAQVEAVKTFIDTYDAQLRRFSKRRSEPHLLVQMSLDELSDTASQQLFDHYKGTLDS